MRELRFLANLETGVVRITNQHGIDLFPPAALRLYEPTAEELRQAAESLARAIDNDIIQSLCQNPSSPR